MAITSSQWQKNLTINEWCKQFLLNLTFLEKETKAGLRKCKHLLFWPLWIKYGDNKIHTPYHFYVDTCLYKSIALYKLTSPCLHPKLCAPIQGVNFCQEIPKTKDVSQKIAELTKSESRREYLCLTESFICVKDCGTLFYLW